MMSSLIPLLRRRSRRVAMTIQLPTAPGEANRFHVIAGVDLRAVCLDGELCLVSTVIQVHLILE